MAGAKSKPEVIEDFLKADLHSVEEGLDADFDDAKLESRGFWWVFHNVHAVKKPCPLPELDHRCLVGYVTFPSGSYHRAPVQCRLL